MSILIKQVDPTLVEVFELIHQRKAIDLYKKLGYSEIAPFGDYTEDPLSVFMEKKIGG